MYFGHCHNLFEIFVNVTCLGPTVIHPQYYGVQTPWGIYPASIIQQGQQTPQGLPSQPLRSGSGRLTPSGQSDSLNNSSNQLQTLPTAQGECTGEFREKWNKALLPL